MASSLYDRWHLDNEGFGESAEINKALWDERLHPRDDHGRFIHGLGLGPLPGRDDIRTYRKYPKNKRGAYEVGDNVNAAAEALAAGDKVELNQPDQVATLLHRLADVVNEMKDKGKAAPNFDLCKVSVKNTNLFCVESKGIPRVKMPQLKGVPLKGSKADKMKRDPRGEVDIQPMFDDYLKEQGVHIDVTHEPASHLRATQRELNGAKTAGIMKFLDEGGVLEGAPLLISHDNYIVDGHHRWSATVAKDIEDNHLGDLKMEVAKTDAGIIQLLALSKRFAAEWGIPQADVSLQNTGTTGVGKAFAEIVRGT